MNRYLLPTNYFFTIKIIFLELIQVYALMATVCIVCLLNYFMFRSFYNEFDERYRFTIDAVKKKMMQINKEMEELLKERMLDGEEPHELIEFGRVWRKKLHELHGLEEERNTMDGHIVFQYYLLMFGLAFAVYDLLNPWPVMMLFGKSVHLYFLGWIFTLIGVVFIIVSRKAYIKLINILKENQTLVTKVYSEETIEDDLQVYKIERIQDDTPLIKKEPR